MEGAGEPVAGPVFTNPLDVTLGDPFVLKHRGWFYLYGTNDGPPLSDGREIPVFRSDDLVRWEPLGGALEPLEPGTDHWAPEVLYWNGRFFMVVSFGDVDRVGSFYGVDNVALGADNSAAGINPYLKPDLSTLPDGYVAGPTLDGPIY